MKSKRKFPPGYSLSNLQVERSESSRLAARAAGKSTLTMLKLKCYRYTARDAMHRNPNASTSVMSCNGWRALRCKTCRKTKSSARWKFTCGCKWHQCSVHLHAASARKPQKSAADVSSTKRQRVTQLPPPRIVNRTCTYAFRHPATLRLGPKLAERFPHLAT